MKKIFTIEHFDDCEYVKDFDATNPQLMLEMANIISSQGGNCKPHVGVDCPKCHYAIKTYE